MASRVMDILDGIKSSFKPKIDISYKIASIRQIAVMTDAGISIHDAVDEVAKNMENRRLKSIYSTISNDINAGKGIGDVN